MSPSGGTATRSLLWRLIPLSYGFDDRRSIKTIRVGPRAVTDGIF